MATTIPCKIHIPLRLPRPLNPTKPPASKTARPANCELVVGRADPATYPPLLSLKSAAATRPNLHSLNLWPAVQCNEGFCNASEGQRLPLTTTMASQKPHHYGRTCTDRERPRPNRARARAKKHAIKSAFEEADAGWLVLAEQTEWIDRERVRKIGADEPS
jgi:hypothetical protein